MTTSDALVVGEDFISEHYFSTDAKSQSFQAKVLERRKEWDAAKDARHPTPLSRYSEERGVLAKDFNGLSENADEDVLDPLYSRLRSLLGFDSTVRWDINRLGGSDTAEGPVIAYRARDLSAPAPFVVVEARGGLAIEDLLAKDEKTLLRAFHTEDGDVESAAKLLSQLFVADNGPQFALVVAGGLALVTERERWLEGRYLAIDLQLVGERNDTKRGGEIDRALTCLSADSLAPDAEGNVWWSSVIEESIKHTVGVSQDLREGVRLSIEIIANDVVVRRLQKGIEALPADQAQPLARQSLRFLYRILFLLYAEASPELAVLPVGVDQYERGYSLDRLRELSLVELASPRAQSGTHLFDSLAALFNLVDRGHEGSADVPEETAAGVDGLTFRSLKADLFRPSAISFIDQVGLGNQALQQVLRHLLLSKEAKGRDRGFISYAQLGINQLGAVYEGLMSYTGVFAEEDLYEVAKNGDSSKGSWVVPADRIDGISESDFVRVVDETTGEPKPVVHERGTFVYRLAGRERQQSASYYSPEVLTRFVVGQALEELLDRGEVRTSASNILNFTVCEPALGSGAFAIEAVQQLAEQYLTRRQDELGERIDPDQFVAELQRVKAYIALHNVYGVDLNATAVEFAEISLWLSTMGEGLAAPWFGLHLRRGNSLVGARRAFVSASDLRAGGWTSATPIDEPLSSLGGDLEGAVQHFLLPAEGWGSSCDAQEARDFAPEAFQTLRQWRKSLRAKLSKKQLAALAGLARRADRLWWLAQRRLQIAETQIRRPIQVWGADALPFGGEVSREEIEVPLADPSGAYQRLRRVMDAWCALWIWPLVDNRVAADSPAINPPKVDQWIEALEQLLGLDLKVGRRDQAQLSLTVIEDWNELGVAESNDLAFAQAKPVSEVLKAHPWLVVCESVAARHGYLHWELDFSSVFARGGFDLQVGNPPWVRPTWDLDAALAESDPWFKLAVKPTQAQIRAKRENLFAQPEVTAAILSGSGEVAGIAAFLGDHKQYPVLKGLQPDFYRCFMMRTWAHCRAGGIVSLIHPESHFTDEKARLLREQCYRRLRRHWQFVNELKLFDIDNHVDYGVHIYGDLQEPKFLNACSLYHPDTVVRSLVHDGSGDAPGLKNDDGKWDVRPHASRLVTVDVTALQTWKDILEQDDDVPVLQARMVYTVNRSSALVLEKLSNVSRVGSLNPHFSSGWHETSDRVKGFFESVWGKPEDWQQVILQGPHIHVLNPVYKIPNPTMLSNRDWTSTDLEALTDGSVPATSYQPKGSSKRYDAAYPSWQISDSEGTITSVSARSFYRLAWRAMATNTNERTLMPAIIPPGAAHVLTIFSFALPQHDLRRLVITAAGLSSLLADFSVRSSPKKHIIYSTIMRLPLIEEGPIAEWMLLRALRLNCVTAVFRDLWEGCFDSSMKLDSWTGDVGDFPTRLETVEHQWTAKVPLRMPRHRRQAQVEIDALVGLGLGLTADELCTVYRTQFPVLHGYDRRTYLYDRNGRAVPSELLTAWRKYGDDLPLEARSLQTSSGNRYTYELPFGFLDREADMRAAYAEFERRLAASGLR